MWCWVLEDIHEFLPVAAIEMLTVSIAGKSLQLSCESSCGRKEKQASITRIESVKKETVTLEIIIIVSSTYEKLQNPQRHIHPGVRAP